MQLDHTRIAIRERSLLDILDLSLRVVAAYPVAILLGTALAALPLMILNESLCGWMLGDGDDPSATLRYLVSACLLVVVEAPLASVFVTLYLGQALFMETPRIGIMLQSLRRAWFALTWCQGVLRGVIAAWILAALVDRTRDFSGQEGWTILLVVVVCCCRAFRPFINEIILLERSPLRSKGDERVSIRRRSASLHRPRSGDLCARWLLTAGVGISLTFSILFTIWYAQGMLLMRWDWGWTMLHIGVPTCLWTVAGYLTVVRFLSYLDLRIRQEGWEVELGVRAAAASLTGVTG